MKLRRRHHLIAVFLTALLMGMPASSPSLRAQGSASPLPEEGRAVGFAVSGPASELPAASPEEKDGNSFRRGREEDEGDAENVRTPSASVVADADDAVQDAVTEAPDPVFGGGPLVSFETLSNADNFAAFAFRVSPPDTNMDVGPNHVVQTVNLLVRVYNKSGAPLTPPFKMSSLFASLGGICSTDDDGDPIVLYDPLADRWLISQFAFVSSTSPPYHQCVAVSKTADPSGAYFLYDFVVPNNEFNDYPKFGVWPDAYYMTVNQFRNGGPFDGTGAYAFDRNKMLEGDPTAGFVYFNLNLASHPEGIGGMLPSDVDGRTPPAVGTPNTFSYFVATEFGDAIDGLRLFDFHVDFASPAGSTFTERLESPVAVAAFDPTFTEVSGTATSCGPNPPNAPFTSRDDIPQPPPANSCNARLDAIADRLMYRLQYRNFGTHESLVTTHTVDVNATPVLATTGHRAGIRYYELRRSSGGGWAVNEQGTIAGPPGDSANRWMGSAAIDNSGNLAVGYSVSSATIFPSIRYAGRLASDPPGPAQGEKSLVAGSGAQRSTGSRWGDYSMLAVDPADECTFWYAQQYYTAASQATSTVGWLTRVGSFKFGACTPPPPNGTLQGVVTSCDTALPVTGALVHTTNGFAGTTGASGSYSISLPAGTYSAIATKLGYEPASASGLVVADGGTTTQNFCITPVPELRFSSFSVSGGNGNGVVEFNECSSLNVSLKNIGAAAANGVSAHLSTSTPNVTIGQSNSPYPDVAAGGSATNSVPFEVSTSASMPCGTIIDFSLTATFTGGSDSVTFSVPTCTPQTTTVTGSITAADPQQNLRLFRNGVSSACANPKAACPGVFGTGTRSYDAYTFTNTTSSACVTFDLTSGCGTNIYGTVYKGSFNPANICQNYLADQGVSSSGTARASFVVGAGESFVVVVNEVNQGAGCASYAAKVSGLFSATHGGGECVPCTIACPADTVVSNGPGQCGAVVSYPPAVLNGSCGVLTETPPPGSFFPVGSTLVSSSATAGQGCTRRVVVNDAAPPVITGGSVDPPVLWPPNHQLVPVAVSYASSDNCAGSCSLSVTSDQPANGQGDGNTEPDWQVVDAHTVLLRAERSGNVKAGRSYTITITCTDTSGNVAQKQVTVRVPHSQGE